MSRKATGSIWVISYEGKEWPVMLCENDLPPKKFTDTKPSGDPYASILLGRRIYKWVVDHQLREFDPHKKYIEDQPYEEDILPTDSVEVKLEKERLTAFHLDVRDPRTPAFWKNCIEQRSKMRACERKIEAKRKRPADDDSDIEIIDVKRGASASTSPSKGPRTAFRHRSKRSHLPPPKATPIKSEFGGSSHLGYTRFKRALEDSDEDDLFVSESNSLSNRFKTSGHDLKEDDLADNNREKNIEAVKDNPPADAYCTIFVGSDQQSFGVRKDKVGKCDFLTDGVAFTEELKSYIDLEDTDITPEEFKPIADYLSCDEFVPRLSSYRRLEGVVLSEEQQAAAMNVTKVYLTSLKLEFGALQLLCLDKLKALDPLSPRSLLIVLTIIRRARAYEDKAVHNVQEWLVNQLAKHFWKLMQYEGQTFGRLMSEDDEMARCVFQTLTRNPRVALKVD